MGGVIKTAEGDLTTLALNMAETKAVVTAALAGGMFTAMGHQGGVPGAIEFAAEAALAVSLGDTITTAFGLDAKIQNYIPAKYDKYFSPTCLLAGAVGGLIIGYSLGVQGRELTMAIGMTAASGAFAPPISAWLVKTISPNGVPNYTAY